MAGDSGDNLMGYGGHSTVPPRRFSRMAMDPVCNIEVDEGAAMWTSEYQGTTYYFCAPQCKAAFDADPVRFLRGP